MSILNDLIARFPEIDPVQAAETWPRLENVWPCYYGGKYAGCGVEIILNLIAHLIIVDQNAGTETGLPVASQSVLSVSESYAARSKSNWRTDFFSSTKYGENFIFLTSQRFGALFV